MAFKDKHEIVNVEVKGLVIRGRKGDAPVRGVDYFTEEDVNSMIYAVSSGAEGNFNANAKEKAEQFDLLVGESISFFNKNANNKTTEYDTNAKEKFSDYNENASTKKGAFDVNADEKFTAYNDNARGKERTFNANAEEKFIEYNDNADKALTEFDANAVRKTDAFNTNADDKTTEYDTNAGAKLKSFNDNADTKYSGYNSNADMKFNAYNENDAAKTAAYNANAKEKLDEYNDNVGDFEKEVNTLKEDLSDLTGRVDNIGEVIDASIEPLKRDATDADRRLTNLEYASRGVLYREDENESVDYVKEVPGDVMPYAVIDKFGCKSIVWNNIYNNEYYLSVQNPSYSRIEISEDKRTTRLYVSCNDENAPSYRYRFLNANFLKPDVYAHVLLLIANINSNNNYDVNVQLGATSFDISPNKKYFNVYKINGQDRRIQFGYKSPYTFKKDDYLEVSDISVIDLTKMFGEGNEPTLEQCKQIFTADYYPYNEGEIVTAEADEIVSVGRNLLELTDDNIVRYSDFYSKYEYIKDGYKTTGPNLVGWKIKVKPNTKYRYSGKTNASSNMWRILEYGNEPSNFTDDFIIQSVNASGRYTLDITFNTSSETRWILVAQYSETVGSFTNIQITEGDAVTEYTPYKSTAIDASSIISKYFPDGMHSAGEVYDEIDVENGVAVQRVGNVCLKDLDFCIRKEHIFTSTEIPNLKMSKSYADIGNALSSTYDISYIDLVDKDTFDKKFAIHPIARQAWFCDLKSNEPYYFKLNNNQVKIYYELAEPITIPIDEADLFALRTLEVEAGGTLTFKNKLDGIDLPIPNKETFLVKTNGGVA